MKDDDLTVFDEASWPEPTAASLSEYLADYVSLVHDMRGRIKAGVMEQFQPAAQAAAEVMKHAAEDMELWIGQACAVEQQIQTKIRNEIEPVLHAAEMAVNVAQGKINREQARLQRKAEKDTITNPTHADGAAGPPAQSAVPTGPAPSVSSKPGPVIPAGLGASPSLRPPPIPLAQRANLGWITKDGESMLWLHELPDDFFQPTTETGAYVARQIMPLTRAVIPTWERRTDGIVPAGAVYFQVNLPASNDTVKAMLAELGIDTDAVEFWSVEQSWDASSQLYGTVTAAAVFDANNVPHPPIAPELNRHTLAAELEAQAQAAGNGQNGPISTENDTESPFTSLDNGFSGPGSRGDGPESGQGSPQNTANGVPGLAPQPANGPSKGIGQAAGPEVCIPVCGTGSEVFTSIPGQLGQAAGRFFGGGLDVCILARPVLDYFGLDADRMIPCAGWRDTVAYLNEKSGAR